MIFFTAVCKDHRPLLRSNDRKQIVLDSLRFLVEDGRIWLYAYVIMHNHIHLLWRKKEKWLEKDIQQMFMKYTAQQLKFYLQKNSPDELSNFVSSQVDREFHFWQRGSYKARMPSRKIAEQKLDYIHANPVKAGLCQMEIDFQFSSARYYETEEDNVGILTHYAEHM